MLQWALVTVAAAGFFLVLQQVDSCNEAVCGSIVSKCLLTQSCKCDLKNCTCCRECYSCLSVRYSECCSCVDMCPKPNDTGMKLSKQSYVEDFTTNIPGLFTVLTELPDPHDRWLSFTYPIDLDIQQFAPKKDPVLQIQSAEHQPSFNCTVAFMSQCINWTKCRSSCQSMGASSFRWFHNGCCECVGDTCINYGMKDPKCLQCRHQNLDDEEIDDLEDDDNSVFDDEVNLDDDDDLMNVDSSTTN